MYRTGDESDLIQHEAHICLLAETAAKAAQDLQTESLISSGVIARVDICLDLKNIIHTIQLTLINQMHNETLLSTVHVYRRCCLTMSAEEALVHPVYTMKEISKCNAGHKHYNDWKFGYLAGGQCLAGLTGGQTPQDPEVLQQQEKASHSRLPSIQLTTEGAGTVMGKI